MRRYWPGPKLLLSPTFGHNPAPLCLEPRLWHLAAAGTAMATIWADNSIARICGHTRIGVSRLEVSILRIEVA